MHSLDFSKEAIAIKEKLEKMGHQVSQCYSVSRVEKGDLSVQSILDMKENKTFYEYTISKDLIKWNFNRLKKDDAILVINISKKGVDNYIGGNTFLEMGFAHVLNKKIFLLNDIPNMSYTDEIKAMQPMVLNNNLDKIK